MLFEPTEVQAVSQKRRVFKFLLLTIGHGDNKFSGS